MAPAATAGTPAPSPRPRATPGRLILGGAPWVEEKRVLSSRAIARNS